MTKQSPLKVKNTLKDKRTISNSTKLSNPITIWPYSLKYATWLEALTVQTYLIILIEYGHDHFLVRLSSTIHKKKISPDTPPYTFLSH